jgi:small subunit ribosomal protein S16
LPKILAECMPHLLSFGALSRRTAQIHRDHRERAPTALDGITPTWPARRPGRNTITGVTTHVAVKIRLKRFGKIRSPHYRIVVADSRTKRDGRAIEEIGKYHPKNDPSLIEVDSERAQYWLSVGAQPSEAVVALLKRTGDWQKFSGDTSPSGVLPQPEKPNKTDVFNAALADAGKEPRAAASKTAKKAATKPESTKTDPASVEGTPEEAQQAAEAGVADADSSES